MAGEEMTGKSFAQVDGDGGQSMSIALGTAGERSLGEFRREAAIDVISRHEGTLRRTARRYSICADDAEDAYQRALEILLTKAPPITGDSLIRWMQTVTKREALGVRRQRVRLIGSPPPSTDDSDLYDPFESIASEAPQPDEQAARVERIRRSSEALRALKPQEVRALILKAEGYSYQEIQEITGWTYTKVNRCMAEGRKRFLGVFAEIESGDRCEQWARGLSLIADGEDGEQDLTELRIHLRTCAICRARLREYRRVPKRALGLGLPLPLLGLVDWFDSRGAAAHDRFRGLTASVSRVFDSAGERVFTFASTGGTRGAGTIALAKVLAVCGMAAAGSAACAVSGVLPEPPASEARAQGTEIASPVVPDGSSVDPTPQQAEVAAVVDRPPQTPTEQSASQFSFEAPSGTPTPSPAPPQPQPRQSATPQPQFGFEQ